MIKDEEALTIITKTYDKMKEEGVSSYRGNKPNMAEISRRTGLSRKKIQRLMDNGLQRKKPEDAVSSRSRIITQELAEIADGYLQQGITNSSVIYNFLKARGYKGGLTTVKNHIRDNMHLVPAKRNIIMKPQGKVSRYETGPGEMFQMDWGFVNVIDLKGDCWRCACFAMVCHHCGKRFIEFFPNAKQESLFIGMIHALGYMGIPKIILTDNMASVSNRRDNNGNPVFNKEYEVFQDLVGFETRLCRPRHPWTKGSVERLVRFVKDNFIQGKVFCNVTDLNSQALSWCMAENSRLQKGLGVIPDEEHRKEPLLSLPQEDVLLPYLAPERKITAEGFIFYEGRRYGVPFSYRQRTAKVLRHKDTLYILDPSFNVIEQHKVDWSYRPHYSETQFEPYLPEEHPTARVYSTISIAEPESEDFSRFSF